MCHETTDTSTESSNYGRWRWFFDRISTGSARGTIRTCASRRLATSGRRSRPRSSRGTSDTSRRLPARRRSPRTAALADAAHFQHVSAREFERRVPARGSPTRRTAQAAQAALATHGRTWTRQGSSVARRNVTRSRRLASGLKQRRRHSHQKYVAAVLAALARCRLPCRRATDACARRAESLQVPKDDGALRTRQSNSRAGLRDLSVCGLLSGRRGVELAQPAP
ncbi:MAG: hypothetical protein JWN48_1194 [Myxococcaceae bacterium]|nr:hypothetical protein [Myxococcaceae bacterium]